MQSDLHQLNASYDSLQDRIRFCFSTKDGNEFRFWLTRRYLGLLLKTLSDIATQYANTNAAGDITARHALSELAQMRTLNETDSETHFEGGNQYPLGEEPLLVSKIVIKQDGSGNTTLGLMPEEGAGADLGINEAITHLMADLLTRTAMQAEWQLMQSPLVPPAWETAGSVRLH